MYVFSSSPELASWQFSAYVNRLYDTAPSMTVTQRMVAAGELVESFLAEHGAPAYIKLPYPQVHKSWMSLIPGRVWDKLYSAIDYEYHVDHDSTKIRDENSYHTDKQTKRRYETQTNIDPTWIDNPLRVESDDQGNDNTPEAKRPARRYRESMHQAAYVHPWETLTLQKTIPRFYYPDVQDMINGPLGLSEVSYMLRYLPEIESRAYDRGDYDMRDVMLDFATAMRKALTSNQRECVYMWQDGHSYTDIGHEHGVSSEAASRTIDRAIVAIANFFGEQVENVSSRRASI